MASSSVSASADGNQDAARMPWRLKDRRITRAGRQQTNDRIRPDRWKTRSDSRVGKPRIRTYQVNRDRFNKKRPKASAPASAQVAAEVPLTRASNLRRFAEVQELPLQVISTVANEQELRLRLVAVESSGWKPLPTSELKPSMKYFCGASLWNGGHLARCSRTTVLHHLHQTCITCIRPVSPASRVHQLHHACITPLDPGDMAPY